MDFDKLQCVVVKIGSSLLVDETGTLRHEWMQSLAEDISTLRQQDTQVILVSSGAVALGRQALNASKKTLTLPEKQAAAACGQPLLVAAWQKAFSDQSLTAAQLLITPDVTENRRAYLNARNTLNTLLQAGAIPIINENDTTATAELRYGDNDRLAARVAQMAGADALILLSDVDGLYTSNPQKDTNATLLTEITEITPEIEAMAGDSTNIHGSGGMATKIEAAKIATKSGCHTFICNGRTTHPLQQLQKGEHSLFKASEASLSARKQWITGTLTPAGKAMIDEGAAKALSQGGSLLPAGVTHIEGNFGKGDTLTIHNAKNQLIAKGLSNYDAEEARKIIGKHSDEIESLLGYYGAAELIHRDHLVMESSS